MPWIRRDQIIGAVKIGERSFARMETVEEDESERVLESEQMASVIVKRQKLNENDEVEYEVEVAEWLDE